MSRFHARWNVGFLSTVIISLGGAEREENGDEYDDMVACMVW